MTETSHEFNWYSDEDTDHIVVRQQPATAVYISPYNEVVIRQQGDYRDDDHWVHLTKDNAARVASAILKAIAAIELSASAPGMGAAERTVEQSPPLLTFIDDKEVRTE
jgi:hypothetical protein